MGDAHAGDLHFRALTDKSLADLFTLMEGHRIFASCACMKCRLRPDRFDPLSPRQRREALRACVHQGSAVGVLAYDHDAPVAWCSVAPRKNYAALSASRSLAPLDDAEVWSVSCFWVKPALRRRGVASALLRAAVDYARSQGARIVEGYPVSQGHPDHRMGSAGIFRRAGFRDVTPPGRRRTIMRNVLG